MVLPAQKPPQGNERHGAEDNIHQPVCIRVTE
jgi:hypothetical protein